VLYEAMKHKQFKNDRKTHND